MVLAKCLQVKFDSAVEALPAIKRNTGKPLDWSMKSEHPQLSGTATAFAITLNLFSSIRIVPRPLFRVGNQSLGNSSLAAPPLSFCALIFSISPVVIAVIFSPFLLVLGSVRTLLFKNAVRILAIVFKPFLPQSFTVANPVAFDFLWCRH